MVGGGGFDTITLFGGVDGVDTMGGGFEITVGVVVDAEVPGGLLLTSSSQAPAPAPAAAIRTMGAASTRRREGLISAQ